MHFGYVIENHWNGKILTSGERWVKLTPYVETWTKSYCKKWLLDYKRRHPNTDARVVEIYIPYMLTVAV